MGNLLALKRSVSHTIGMQARRGFHVQLTKNTTVTFSESFTPASGSASTSSPGPGMARLTPKFSVDFFLAAVDGSESGGIFLDDEDRIELQ